MAEGECAVTVVGGIIRRNGWIFENLGINFEMLPQTHDVAHMTEFFCKFPGVLVSKIASRTVYVAAHCGENHTVTVI